MVIWEDGRVPTYILLDEAGYHARVHRGASIELRQSSRFAGTVLYLIVLYCTFLYCDVVRLQYHLLFPGCGPREGGQQVGGGLPAHDSFRYSCKILYRVVFF